MNHPSRGPGGIGFAVAAVALFAAYDNGTKLISAVVPVALVLWTRYLLQILWILARRRALAAAGAFHTRRKGLHVLRAAVLLACNVAAFFSYKQLPVAPVTAIAMLSPLLVTAVAALAFAEPVTPRQWLWIVGGLAGALMITRPGAENLSPLLLLPLAFLLTYTAFQTITSRLTRTESPDTVLVWTSGIGFAALSLLLPLSWTGWPAPRTLAILLAATLCSAVGHHLLVLAYQRTAASRVTPFIYLQLPFATLGGFLLFGEVPDGWSAAGGALIAACGVLSALEARRAPPAPATAAADGRRAA